MKTFETLDELAQELDAQGYDWDAAITESEHIRKSRAAGELPVSDEDCPFCELCSDD